MEVGATFFADAKRWKAEKVKEQEPRPLKGYRTVSLQSDGAIEAIQQHLNLPTLADARDIIGEELRIRTTQAVGGYFRKNSLTGPDIEGNK